MTPKQPSLFNNLYNPRVEGPMNDERELVIRFTVMVGKGWATVEIPADCPDEKRWERYVAPAVRAAQNVQAFAVPQPNDDEPEQAH